VFFSVGWGNRFGQPAAEAVQRYASLGAQILRTDRDGGLLLVQKRKPLAFRMGDGDWLAEMRPGD
jgi:beta-lactamase superfamily II metal-dependent hydrolase